MTDKSEMDLLTPTEFAELAGVRVDTIKRCYCEVDDPQKPQRVRENGVTCFYRYQVESELRRSGNRLKQIDANTRPPVVFDPNKRRRESGQKFNDVMRSLRTGGPA